MLKKLSRYLYSIEVLSEKAQEIIRENTVLTLERGGKELFGRSWNEQATK